MSTESLFMQIEGVKGTVSNKGFEGWISVDNINFGVYCSAKIDNASGQVNSDGVNFDAISFSKLMDTTSTQLANMVAQGSNLKQITIVKALFQGDKMVQALKLNYKNCVLTSYNFAAHSAGDVPSEGLSFVFGQMTFETNMVEPDGKTSKQGPVGWNLVENTKL
uniref:Hcp family type VI secretion system effector n=1 Tax=Buttiauxella sp. TaxID=1972222 RepID=UPI003C71F7A3